MKIYVSPGYSTSDFLLSWTEFISDCGVPRLVHSDRGTQLISAADIIESPNYDWMEIKKQIGAGTQWNFCPSGAQWRNGAIESQVKRFKNSLQIYKYTGLTYAELQSLFKKIVSVLNSRPIAARYGPRHGESDPDFLELITPNMLLTARSGVDLPSQDFIGDENPGRRLAYRLELENNWWEQWKKQCFDSCLPSKTWFREERGVKQGDVVLINYVDKSKLGTWKLGIVESVEFDDDGLVRTCIVGYRLVIFDLPMEEMKIYFKGLTFKKIRVPVQRLSLVLPVEEQGLSSQTLMRTVVMEGSCTLDAGIQSCSGREAAVVGQSLGWNSSRHISQFSSRKKRSLKISHTILDLHRSCGLLDFLLDL